MVLKYGELLLFLSLMCLHIDFKKLRTQQRWLFPLVPISLILMEKKV